MNYLSRFLRLALSPLPNAVDWWTIVIGIGTMIGFGGLAAGVSALGDWGVKQGGLVGVLLGAIVLLVVAGCRVERRIEALLEASPRPLHLVSIDNDRGFRRLVLHNPNRTAAEGCSVEVLSYDPIGATPPPRYGVPPRGFHFCWSTHRTSGGSGIERERTLGPEADGIVDLAVLNDGMFWRPVDLQDLRGTFLTPIPDRAQPHLYTRDYPLRAGSYRVAVTVGAKNVPAADAILRFVFDGEHSLVVEIERS